jgi:hypothetical protein
MVMAIILSGLGYAAWTDKLTINTTVSTGQLNVEFVAAGLNSERVVMPKVKRLETEGSYLKSSIEIDDQDTKKLKVRLENMYPGSGILYAAKLENTGTIPAVIDGIDVSFVKDNALLRSKLIVVGGYEHYNEKDVRKGGNYFPSYLRIQNDLVYLKDLRDSLNFMLRGVKMEPGDYITLDIPEVDKPQIVNVLNKNSIKGFDPENDNCIIMSLPNSVEKTWKSKV